MGLLIGAVMDEDPEVRALMEDLNGLGGPIPPDREAAAFELLAGRITLEDLDRLYPEAAARGKQDPDYRERARKLTAELQAKTPGYHLLWRHFSKVTRVALERDFHSMGVDFDLWKGESDVDDLIAPMVRALTKIV